MVFQKKFEWKYKLLINLTKVIKLLHQEEIVHGDLKPSNILINDIAEVYIIDFDNSFEFSKPPIYQEIIGDLFYMPPEFIHYIRLEGDFNPNLLNLKSDIYSLGNIFCSIIFGQSINKIWNDKPLYEKIYNQEKINFPVNEFSQELIELLNSMLQFSNERRPKIEDVEKKLKSLKHEILNLEFIGVHNIKLQKEI